MDIHEYRLAFSWARQNLSKTNANAPSPISMSVRTYSAKSDQKVCGEIKQFIERHEWLGKMPHRPTHRFIATYKLIYRG